MRNNFESIWYMPKCTVLYIKVHRHNSLTVRFLSFFLPGLCNCNSFFPPRMEVMLWERSRTKTTEHENKNPIV